MANDSYSLILLFFTLLLGVVVYWLLLLQWMPKTHNTTFSRPVTRPPSKYQDCVCKGYGLSLLEAYIVPDGSRKIFQNDEQINMITKVKYFNDLAVGQFFTVNNPLGAILFQKTNEDGYLYWKNENEPKGMSDDTFSDGFALCKIVRRPDWLESSEPDYKFWKKEEVPEKGIYKIKDNCYLNVLGIVDDYFECDDENEFLLIERIPEGDYKLISHSSWISYFQDYMKDLEYWGKQ